NHWMAGVVVRHGKKQAGATNHLGQVQRIVESGGKRLVANNVDASLEKRLRRGIVQMVRGHDGYGINAVFPSRLDGSHLPEIRVCAIWRNVQIKRGRTGTNRVGGQRTSHQLETVVKTRGKPMDGRG